MEERLADALRELIRAIDRDERDDEQTISQDLWDARDEAKATLIEYER